MRSQQAPWWVLAAAATFVSFYALLLYCDFRRPADEGFTLRPTSAGLAVGQVHPGSAGEAAGLAPGDLIVAAGGHALSSRLDWSTTRANARFGRPTPLEVERGGRRLRLELRNDPASWRRWLSRGGLGLIVAFFVQGITLALGVLILLRRQDLVARLGAWVLGCLGVFVVALPARVLDLWRAVPDLAREALWLPFAATYVAPAVLLSFFLSFPVRRVRSPWLWALVWLPVLAASVAPLRYHGMALYFPDAPRPPSGQGVWLAVTIAYALATAAVALLGYRTLRRGDERRRVRVLAVGAVAACVAGVPAIVGYWRSAGSLLLFESPTVGIAALLMLLAPLSFAYAILEHRLFDITFIVRQGVRYAMARRVLLSVVPAMVALLAIDLYTRRGDAIAEVVATRGTIYLVLAGAAIVAHRSRDRWLEALDRRFFRERYDAQRLLARLVDEVGSAASLEQAASHLAARIHVALHPAFAVVLAREAVGEDYRRIVAVPPDQGPASLADGGRMVTLARLLGRPVQTPASEDEEGWLEREVGAEEAARLREAHVEVLVPIPSGGEASAPGGGPSSDWHGLLALGPRLSEQPYAAEDLDLLRAAAQSLGALRARAPRGTDPQPPRFAECPRCGRCFDESQGACAEDGSPLVASALPRLLLGRYRIERRLDRGGMGVVYAAADQALDREVAVKVLRDELAADAGAVERFQCEARLAARFSHPNVVTVHDFGVAAGRGFLVMELLTGSSLRHEIEREPFTAARVIEVLGPVCAAVDAAHRRGLVHRDLKPENIFLARLEGVETPKVLDFGISKAGGAFAGGAAGGPAVAVVQTAPGVLVGTPEYMAPEQIRGEDVRPAWDLWALAMIAYEMLTGRRPVPAGFSDGSGAAFLGDSELPAGARLLFQRALSIDPALRPASAREFHEELHHALAGGGGR